MKLKWCAVGLVSAALLTGLGLLLARYRHPLFMVLFTLVPSALGKF